MNAIKIYDNKSTENEPLLQIFSFEGSKVRMILDEQGEPWFIAKDIATILGHTSAKDATRILESDEKGFHIVPTIQGAQKLTIINESGLYSLIFLSRKSEAKKFKKWVTSEVLPAIRKTGGYGQQINLKDPIQLKQLLMESTDRVIELEYQQQVSQPKVDFFDSFINSEGLYNLQNAARALGLQPNLFINSLKNNYLFYQGNALVPYQPYKAQGLFIVKSNTVDHKSYYQTYITPKGLEYFAKRINVNQTFYDSDNANYQSTIINNITGE